MESVMNNYSRWFGRIVWLGIFANLSFALPAIFIPGRVLALLNLQAAVPTVWVRFAGLLLLLLSMFYIPAATNVYRYRTIAWMALFARLAGVLFFLGGVILYSAPREYLPFGFVDLVFFVAQSIFLFLALRHERWA